MAAMERIELNAKTNMTVQDGQVDAGTMISAAAALRQPAIAICDCHTVLVYPAMARAGVALDFNVIYGIEIRLQKQNAILLLKAWDEENAIFRLLSETKFYADQDTPVLSKSELEKYRDDILIGSPDDTGEISLALEVGEDDESIIRRMAFYDYIELLPAACVEDWIMDIDGFCQSLGDVQNRQKRLLTLAKRLGKPVVATSHPTQAPLSTEEMKQQFSYLDEATVQEIVVENPQLIAHQCGHVQPPARQWHFPHNATLELELVERITAGSEKAYGKWPSPAVRERIDEELRLFQDQGLDSVFAAMVRLCDYSRQQGYPVQARGCLGNLVIAYLTGMVADDPLQHQLPIEGYFGPDRDRLGYFELGFAKEIYDELREQLATYFPEGQIVRGSTVKLTVQEETGQEVRKAWQRHLGSVLIIPDKKRLYEYMPLRRHFDDEGWQYPGLYSGLAVRDLEGIYYSVNLVTSRAVSLIGRLQELTGIPWQDINIRNKDLLLRVRQGDTRGIPELNTPRVTELVAQLRPKNFDELLKVTALQHATNAWESNQQHYFKQQEITLATLLATREDVRDFCISMGLNQKQAAAIMEDAGKGRGLDEKQIRLLREHAAPEWFLACCTGEERIQYLFPRAHCLNTLRLGLIILWYKRHYPQYFFQMQLE